MKRARKVRGLVKRWVAAVGVGWMALGGGGCASTGELRVPAARVINVAFPAAAVQATLLTVIVSDGPGAWRREARWDEFVVTLRNPGAEPLAVTAAELVDFSGVARAAGDDPWRLEAESERLEKTYARDGVAFRKNAPGDALALGAAAAGTAVIATTAGNTSALLAAVAVENGAALPTLPGMVAVAGVAGYALLPGVVLERALAYREARADIAAEFQLRRLALPLTLAPGQTRSGCWFFPMGPNPRALKVRWRRGEETGETVLTLEFLRGLHAGDGR